MDLRYYRGVVYSWGIFGEKEWATVVGHGADRMDPRGVSGAPLGRGSAINRSHCFYDHARPAHRDNRATFHDPSRSGRRGSVCGTVGVPSFS